MTTQPKKPAKRLFDRPIRYRAKARAAVANDMPSTRILFGCKDCVVDDKAVKAGELNPIADIRGAAFIHQRFQFFFCEKRPAFL